MELWAKVAGLVLSPPGAILVTAILGYLVALKWRWTGRILILLSFIALYALSLTPVARQLILPLESQFPPLPFDKLAETVPAADAIVVLGANRYSNAKEYGGADTVNAATLERLRYAAELQRKTDLPILVTGGSPFNEEVAEASMMRDTLEREFKVKVKWVEAKSRNTGENALLSKPILKEAGIKKVFLITHAWHMPRAMWIFTEAGVIAVPAPVAFTTAGKSAHGILGALPSAHGLKISQTAIQERLGLAWYKWKYTQGAIEEKLRPEAAK